MSKGDGMRYQGLDALRGLAILLMVLSGSIAFGGMLPAWMYHAQVPPPLHKYNPDIPGITWVDLVFPFFLFSMGAAIPLALRKYAQEPGAWKQVLWTATRRWLLLVFFALFILHMRAWVIAEKPALREHLLSILAFMLLFGMLLRAPDGRKLWLYLRLASYALAVALLALLPFHQGKGFDLYKSDIIIIVLANMAFFGTLLWWLTRHQPWWRVAVLLVVMAIFLGAKTAGSWNEAVFNWSPAPWMYKLYYLKYLFIIVPGTFAGEWMLQWGAAEMKQAPQKESGIIAWLALAIIVGNTWLLFTRQLELNLALTLLMVGMVQWLLKRPQMQGRAFTQKLAAGAAFLLLLGLCFEAWEGGIHKDPSTYSYYFVTSGLAFYMLIFLGWLGNTKTGAAMVNYLAMNGQNPMIAYVAGALLLAPLLEITHTMPLLDAMKVNAWGGFARGAVYTGIVSLITVYCTRRRWFWKT